MDVPGRLWNVLSGTWVTGYSGHIGNTFRHLGEPQNAVAGVLQDGRTAAVRGSAAGRREDGGVHADQAAAVLRDASTQLVLEIRKTVDFYKATSPIDRLSRLVLSGGAWEAVGLVDMLASEFGAPVDVFDPFRRVAKSSRSAGAENVGPSYAVAVGLAMRKEGDR